MGMLMLTIFQIGTKIAAAHLGGKVEEIAKVPGLVINMAQAVNDLSVSEVGQPIDWNKITEHHHFSEPSEPIVPDIPTEPIG